MQLPKNPEGWLEFYESILDLDGFESCLRKHLPEKFSEKHHGDFAQWTHALQCLPTLEASQIDMDAGTVCAQSASELSAEEQASLATTLMQLHPWRKGPFNLYGVHIDTEWRSDWKWDRLSHALSPLKERTVLDIGTGSGYHLWRMLGAGAKRAIGIEPMVLYVMQFFAVKHFFGKLPAYNLPIGIEDMPQKCIQMFDTVFSMGVLYHRRNPIEHLDQMHRWLSDRGELVLETLVIDGDADTALIPEGRYAKMRNVWFIPSTLMLERWLRRCGFKNIRLVDESITTPHEQRSTAWMHFDSLSTFLDPKDHTRTIEGYPAPKRAIFIASK